MNAKNKDRETALILASRYGRAYVVELLLRHEGIDVNVRSRNGNTALKWASRHERADLVKLLKERKRSFFIDLFYRVFVTPVRDTLK